MLTPSQQAALKLIAQASVQSERETGLPAELTAAQCIFESAWLSVCPGNNCFGIKSNPLDHYGTGSQYCLTKEYVNGTWEQDRLAFETYPTLGACFSEHAHLILLTAVYQPAWEQYQKCVDVPSSPIMRARCLNALSRGIGAHYATDPDYATKIIAMYNSASVVAALEAARAS